MQINQNSLSSEGISISYDDVVSQFDDWTLTKGTRYFEDGHVKKLNVSQKQVLLGDVKGTGRRVYYTQVRYDPRTMEIKGRCSCPVAYNCKHVVACILQYLSIAQMSAFDKTAKRLNRAPSGDGNLDSTKQQQQWQQWFESFDKAPKPKTNTATAPDNKVLYIIDLIQVQADVDFVVKIGVARKLKKGGFGVMKDYTPGSAQEKYCDQQDKFILDRLQVIDNNSDGYRWRYSKSTIRLCDHKFTVSTLRDILNSGRCFFRDYQVDPLQLGESKVITFEWQSDAQGCQSLIPIHNNKPLQLLPLNEPWYIDIENNICGPAEVSVPAKMLSALINMPALPPSEVDSFKSKILENDQFQKLPEPKKYTVKNTLQAKPIPHLTLSGFPIHHIEQLNDYRYAQYSCVIDDDTVPLARVEFEYNGHNIDWSEPGKTINIIDGHQLQAISRDLDAEKTLLDSLLPLQLLPALSTIDAREFPEELLTAITFFEKYEDYDMLAFMDQSIPELKNAGWKIKVEPSFPFSLVKAIDEWYSEVEQSEHDWFGVELGIKVDGEKINLLPILVDMIQQGLVKGWESAPSDAQLRVKVSDQVAVTLPLERIKNILATLSDLFDQKPLDDEGKLKLPTSRALTLSDLDDDLKSERYSIAGGVALREKAKKMMDFSGIKAVKTPKKFKAKLRDYQQHGLDWLQFLTEYDFGGILADDMGLGKTIQALAHLSVEKQAGRLDKPCLIIAPTSLMSNWLNEAAKFAPQLKILVLHGDQRKDLFDQINSNDLIVTTYPLIVRDRSVYLEEKFSHLILDEAQFVKNTKSQAYQVIEQINAQHRLCLTGTPMENHLGELWALASLVNPGLLGTQRQFAKTFRTPIEKHQNLERQQQLARRLKPFMLRRTKDEVLIELPDKQVLIQEVDLESDQRDLYETIRLAMQKKVRKAIDSKGLARSHIIILDALLKLRQVCCDPSILSLDAAKNVKHSAKLDLLMEIVPKLVDEGRRILLFSSFTKMLAVIENKLKEQGLRYVKLTGSTKDRKTPIEKFQSGDVPLFLISLKAGGTGLNLTAADTVIHYDPWWNPAAEDQATDRAHRMGQTKSVFVYKLITKNTVEEKILSMQDKKRGLLSSIYTEKNKDKLKITKQDLDDLFAPID